MKIDRNAWNMYSMKLLQVSTENKIENEKKPIIYDCGKHYMKRTISIRMIAFNLFKNTCYDFNQSHLNLYHDIQVNQECMKQQKT